MTFVLALLPLSFGFVMPVPSGLTSSCMKHRCSRADLRMTASDETLKQDKRMVSEEGLIGRRHLLGTIGVTAAALALPLQEVHASATAPVCVIGASGKTGKECVKYLAAKGALVKAITRSGTKEIEGIDGTSSLISFEAGDVTKPETLASIQGASAVIFAASASKGGGNAKAVDYEGLVNCAQKCLEYNISRLVIVSSGGVSKPDSAVFKFLNLFGEIMTYKIRSEDAVRELYAKSPSDCYYTIVRPGGLTLDAPVGPASLELNQGDDKSGRIARADVAALCVESIYSDSTRDVTFECYNADTAKPLSNVGVSNILKAKVDVGASDGGRERRGSTYAELFDGLKSDSS